MFPLISASAMRWHNWGTTRLNPAPTINDLDEEVHEMPPNFPDDTTLDGGANSSEGRNKIQKNLDRF